MMVCMGAGWEETVEFGACSLGGGSLFIIGCNKIRC